MQKIKKQPRIKYYHKNAKIQENYYVDYEN